MTNLLVPFGYSRGRRNPEEIDYHFMHENAPPRASFMNDIYKILHSKGIRRIENKTQVYCAPLNPHIRLRSTHTHEVAGIAMALAYRLGLNVELCQALALAHDIGHTPFGHPGEEHLRDRSGFFHHAINSVIVLQQIERKGRGINASFELYEGLPYHSSGAAKLKPNLNIPQEYIVVKLADKLAFLFSDINDAIRMGALKEKSIIDLLKPFDKKAKNNLDLQRNRTNAALDAMVEESLAKGYVCFEEHELAPAFQTLKSYMYDNIYTENKKDRRSGKFYDTMRHTIDIAYNFFEEYFEDHQEYAGIPPALATSLLTDDEAKRFLEITITGLYPKFEHVKDMSSFEILPYLAGKTIDLRDTDLDWDTFYKDDGTIEHVK